MLQFNLQKTRTKRAADYRKCLRCSPWRCEEGTGLRGIQSMRGMQSRLEGTAGDLCGGLKLTLGIS